MASPLVPSNSKVQPTDTGEPIGSGAAGTLTCRALARLDGALVDTSCAVRYFVTGPALGIFLSDATTRTPCHNLCLRPSPPSGGGDNSLTAHNADHAPRHEISRHTRHRPALEASHDMPSLFRKP